MPRNAGPSLAQKTQLLTPMDARFVKAVFLVRLYIITLKILEYV